MCLQEDHHLAHEALVLPRAHDAGDALLTEPVHLAEPLRRLLQNAQRVEPERSDDPFGRFLADALDHARSEVLLDTDQRAWQELGDAVGAELLTMLLVRHHSSADA